MMKKVQRIRSCFSMVSFLCLLLLIGCSSAPTIGGTSSPAAQPTATPTDTPTAIPSPTPTPATVPLGTNLIVNGDAERGTCADKIITVVPTISGWTQTSDATPITYAASGGDMGPTSPGPSDRGKCYFWGGPDEGAGGNTIGTLMQTIAVSSRAQMIDSKSLTYQLSAWLGGYTSQDDNATLSIQFLNGSAASLGTASVGPVLAKDRQDTTEMLQRATSGLVPAGTRSIKVTLTITKVAAGDNDGLADDLSLVLQEG
jgi:hypothetical protein